MNNSYRQGQFAEVRGTYPEQILDECYSSADFIEDSKTNFIELNFPLYVCQNEILDIINFSDKDMIVRIYPPFFINRKSAKAAAFNNVFVPTSSSNTCESYLKLPENRLESVEIPSIKDENQKTVMFCHGFRIDVIRSNQDIFKLKDYFLRVIAEHTLQWWINGSSNPFDHGFRLSTKLLNNYQFPLHNYKFEKQIDGSSLIVSTWHPCLGFQQVIGFEDTINANTWSKIKHHIENSLDTNVGIENFNSGISEYMNNQDEKSILSLSLCFEILESKYRASKKMKKLEFKQLVPKSELIRQEDRSILYDLLLVDRGHVAHGNKPPRLNSGIRTMEDYIETMYRYLKSFQEAV